MENPRSWGKAEHIVNEVLEAHWENEQKPIIERQIGGSLAMQITSALRIAGLLTDE